METLIIETIQQKQSSQNKPYWVIKANGTTYGCWDSVVADHLQKNAVQNMPVQVEVTINGQYRNITKFGGVGNAMGAKEIPQTQVETKVSGVTKGTNGQTAMYVSYAKDLIVSGVQIDDAIEQVKKIKTAFE